MSRSAVRLVLFLISIGLVPWLPGAHAQQDVDSKVSSVLLFRGGADVQRVATVQLEAGVHELVFSGIPDPIGEGLEGVRASATDPWKVVGVDVVRREIPIGEMGADGDDLDAALSEARTLRRELELRREGIQADLEFIDSVRIRSAADATADGGTSGLDLDAVRDQLAFVQEERSRMHEQWLRLEEEIARAAERVAGVEEAIRRRGVTREEVVARVRIAVVEAGSGEVTLRYLRSRASWRPTYSIRTTQGVDTMPVEYEAIVAQSTGEDWNDVEIVLSTAVPTRPSGPPEIRPVYVDRRSDQVALNLAEDVEIMPTEGFPALSPSTTGRKLAAVEAMKAAAVVSGGTAVTFALPGRVSVASDDQATTRLRIADFTASGNRVLVARPVAAESVFLRVDLQNPSPFVLLAGSVDLFMQGEYIGPTRLDEVPAGGEFEVWFGPDPSITVTREIVARNTKRTGLLGGGRQTSIEYRVDLLNAGPTAVTIELWDRRPISLDGDIEVSVIDVSPELSQDPAYRDIAERQGLLKWVVDLEPGGSEGAARTISWTVRVNRSSDMDITPIPE